MKIHETYQMKRGYMRLKKLWKMKLKETGTFTAELTRMMTTISSVAKIYLKILYIEKKPEKQNNLLNKCLLIVTILLKNFGS